MVPDRDGVGTWSDHWLTGMAWQQAVSTSHYASSLGHQSQQPLNTGSAGGHGRDLDPPMTLANLGRCAQGPSCSCPESGRGLGPSWWCAPPLSFAAFYTNPTAKGTNTTARSWKSSGKLRLVPQALSWHPTSAWNANPLLRPHRGPCPQLLPALPHLPPRLQSPQLQPSLGSQPPQPLWKRSERAGGGLKRTRWNSHPPSWYRGM